MEKKIYHRYVIYGLLGILLETLWTGLESLYRFYDLTMESTTYIWMFFIYGLAVFLEPIQDKLSNFPLVVRGIVYVILIYMAEILCGLFLRKIIGTCPWNYTDKGAISGIITLSFIPVWFCLGLILERVHKILDTTKIVIKANKEKLY